MNKLPKGLKNDTYKPNNVSSLTNLFKKGSQWQISANMFVITFLH